MYNDIYLLFFFLKNVYALTCCIDQICIIIFFIVHMYMYMYILLHVHHVQSEILKQIHPHSRKQTQWSRHLSLLECWTSLHGNEFAVERSGY